ncbi:MAG TPA: YesL family protein [Lachnospiraceae bacterium]|nr:YesL family protein [Lachnospiraceae bacterium]
MAVCTLNDNKHIKEEKEDIMGGAFNLDGGIMRFLGVISDICIISMMWLIGCIPVVTVGASSTAAYYAFIKVVHRKTGYLHKEFWRSFKMNFKDATILTIIYELIGGILIYNIYLTYLSLEVEYMVEKFYLLFFYVVILMLLFGVMIYTYPALSRFAMKRFQLVRYAVQVMFCHMPSTLLMLTIFIITLYGMVVFPAGVLFMPGICIYLYCIIMERILRKYMTKEMLEIWDQTEEEE